MKKFLFAKKAAQRWATGDVEQVCYQYSLNQPFRCQEEIIPLRASSAPNHRYVNYLMDTGHMKPPYVAATYLGGQNIFKAGTTGHGVPLHSRHSLSTTGAPLPLTTSVAAGNEFTNTSVGKENTPTSFCNTLQRLNFGLNPPHHIGALTITGPFSANGPSAIRSLSRASNVKPFLNTDTSEYSQTGYSLPDASFSSG